MVIDKRDRSVELFKKMWREIYKFWVHEIWIRPCDQEQQILMLAMDMEKCIFEVNDSCRKIGYFSMVRSLYNALCKKENTMIALALWTRRLSMNAVCKIQKRSINWPKILRQICILPYPIHCFNHSIDSFTHILPEHTIVKIFEFMNPCDLVIASETCKLWFQFTASNQYWQKLYSASFRTYNTAMETQCYKRLFKERTLQNQGVIGQFAQWEQAVFMDCPQCGQVKGEILNYQRGLQFIRVKVCFQCKQYIHDSTHQE